jgi:hypothetical protein
MKIRTILALSGLFISTSTLAVCPDGSSFNSALSFCATDTDAYGPFTNAMVSKCQTAGGGSACSNTYTVNVQGKTVSLPRWSKSFTQSIRGTADCPLGSVRSPTYGGHCFEQVDGAANNIYGDFSTDEVAACQSLNGGSACFTNRWSASFYLSVQNKLNANNSGTVENRLGAWLWYIDEAGMNRTHSQLAQELAGMGVKRIFIKIADNATSCSLFADACSTQTTQIYKDAGIEPWAWAYNYPGNYTAQADALYTAAKYGYVGFVSDVEVEFNNTSAELHAMFQAFVAARNDAIRDGYAKSGFPLGATTWSNPIDQGMNVGIIDQYVDFHMPQTYLEVWGASYMANAKTWIEAGNEEYRILGAQKPIWHIVSTEYDEITAAQLNTFIDVAGPNTSIWRIPAGSVPQTVWNDWQQVNWSESQFDANVSGAGNSNDMLPWLIETTPGDETPGNDEPEPPVAAIPYWDQKANYYDPYGSCSITSLAMITDYFGFTNPQVNGRTPDYLYEELGGVLQDVPSLKWGFDQMAARAGSAKRANSTTTGTITQLRQAVTSGKLAIVHGWFTSAGHILVVTGFDGTHYTVNDPYGQWSGVKFGGYDTSKSGKQIKYAKDAFEYAINDNGAGNDLWLHIFE